MIPTPPSLRPSDGHWLYGCTAAPGYIVANAHRIPDQKTEYSKEGNVCHACAEAYIRGEKINVRKIAKQTELDLEFVKEHLAEAKKHARAYADFVQPFKWDGNTLDDDRTYAQWGVEESVDRFYQRGRPAIVDFYAITSRKVTVVDLKYGVGVAVSAVRNKQQAIYARGLIEKHLPDASDDLVIEMHIWQPRVREGEKHTVWRTTWGELRQFCDDEIAAYAEAILNGGAVSFFESDKTCRFCPARKCCDYKDAQRLAELPDIVADEFVPPVIDDIALANLVEHSKDIIKWINDKVEYAQERALRGDIIPNHKLVLSKGAHRTWGDNERAAAKLLRQKFAPQVIWKRTLVSPKQVEDALDAAHVDDDYRNAVLSLAHKPAGQPTLVHISDKREAIGVPNMLDELPDLNRYLDPDLI